MFNLTGETSSALCTRTLHGVGRQLHRWEGFGIPQSSSPHSVRFSTQQQQYQFTTHASGLDSGRHGRSTAHQETPDPGSVPAEAQQNPACSRAPNPETRDGQEVRPFRLSEVKQRLLGLIIFVVFAENRALPGRFRPPAQAEERPVPDGPSHGLAVGTPERQEGVRQPSSDAHAAASAHALP